MKPLTGPNPNCPECEGTGEVQVWYWGDGDRQVPEREACPVCYPPNPVHLIVALAGLVAIYVGMVLIVWLVKS